MHLIATRRTAPSPRRTTPHLRRWLGVSLLLAATTASAADDLKARIAQAMQGTTTPAMGVLVIRDGQVAEHAVQGVRRNDAAPPATIDDQWMIGSTGKPITVAARLLLSNMHEWEAQSHELHELLCALPGEHGQLFTWLDGQMHEHGVQPWAALREGLRGQPFEAMVERLMSGPDGGPVADPEGEQAADAAKELRNVLDFMLDDLLKARQSEAIAAVGSDPQALERYKALEKRRLELRHRLKPSVPG